MKACVWIGACALLLAGNALATDVTVVNLSPGETLNTRIVASWTSGQENINCYLDTPTGETIPFSRDQDKLDQTYDTDKFALLEFNPLSPCAVDVKIIDTKDEGLWTLHYKTNTEQTGSKSYQVNLETSTPETETEEAIEDRQVEYLNGQIFNTAIGSSHEVRINYNDFINTESCHIVAPNEKEYNFDDTASMAALGIKAFRDLHTACGVEINVETEQSVGRWTLLSRDSRFSQRIERRLNITINVEENVGALPAEVTLTNGSDFYVRLAVPTHNHGTCKLLGPNGRTDIPHHVDGNHISACGFIVPDVQMDYAGTWEIVYGDAIIYRAATQVTVNAAWEGAVTKLEWVKDRPVDVEVGPEDAVYCSITAPEEVAVFETFGRCRITLDRATDQHSGTWTMVVGAPGRVLTEQHTLTVHVNSAEPRPEVVTHVEMNQPAILLKCAIEGDHTVRMCKFREPSGRVLMASQGVGEDRYSFHGAGVSLASNVTTNDCGLRITNPEAADLGMWRCSMVTSDDEAYHGFLRVVWPWATADDHTVSTEPTLATSHNQISAVEGDEVTMSCSVQSVIRYCYFRARNGTVFSISPSTQSDVMEYVGAGFDAGECGIRFRNLQERDSGAWSCHVGFTDATAEEQRASFSVNVQPQIAVQQLLISPQQLIVQGRVHDERALEYCRFVRIDGSGFNSQTLPARYTSHDDLSRGLCSITIADPTMLDNHPWTVAAKILGQEVEVYGSSDHTIEMPIDETTPSPQPPHIILVQRNYTWLLFFLLSMSLMIIVLSLTSKKSRGWVHRRATTIRNSFRKQPPPPMAPVNHTPMAA
ncbi:uncharacterized protein LOC114350613 [Ostrinia furnacalis]|uniref:uncharacterized protein LOC114350613 n=1 Tax=Ostrinia furnacalis TaxID=93504 RepID=UPI00103CF42B|nr:uncharacterized protein LOC114350613 [Ostrinia furnacalis]